jgi:hypothetical protein
MSAPVKRQTRASIWVGRTLAPSSGTSAAIKTSFDHRPFDIDHNFEQRELICQSARDARRLTGLARP